MKIQHKLYLYFSNMLKESELQQWIYELIWLIED